MAAFFPALAGWKTIWMNRRNRQKPAHEAGPDFEVSTEEEMAALVTTLVSNPIDFA